MDHDQFWSLIGSVSKSGTEEAKATALTQLLSRKSPEDILDFQIQFETHLNESNTSNLWAAAKLMNGGHCSDDCFEYFRYWLISTGRETFEQALNNPESLAKLDVPMEERLPNPTNEQFGYAAVEAYEKLTGKNIHVELHNLGKSTTNLASFDFKAYTNSVLEKRFPLLWKKYGHYSIEHEQRMHEQSQEMKANVVDVPGLGKISVGTRIHHKRFGDGVVEAIPVSGMALASVQFNDGSHAIGLDSEFIKITKPAKPESE